MPKTSYFKPSEIREGASDQWMSLSTEDKKRIATELGVTTTNIYTAVKLKDKERDTPDTMRGISTCIDLLRALGNDVDPIPRIGIHHPQKTEPAQADHVM